MSTSSFQAWTKEDILSVLPHRDPMIFIDGVEEILDDEITAFRDIHEDDIYFKGHFPTNKIYPGIFMIESAAQSSIILLSHLDGNLQKGLTPLLCHSDFKFKKIVRPNVRIYYSVKLIRRVANSVMVEAEIRVKNSIVAKGKLTFMLKEME